MRYKTAAISCFVLISGMFALPAVPSSSLETVSTRQTALSNRPKSVLPGTDGAGNGFFSTRILAHFSGNRFVRFGPLLGH